MVERQYDILRKERIKGLEEQKNRTEEPTANGNNEPVPAAQTTQSDDAPPQQEVNKFN